MGYFQYVRGHSCQTGSNLNSSRWNPLFRWKLKTEQFSCHSKAFAMSSLVHISCRLIALLFVAANRLADWLNPLNRAGISSFVYWTWRFSMKSFAHQFVNNWIFATRRLTLNDIDSIELRNSFPRTSSHLNELRGGGSFSPNPSANYKEAAVADVSSSKRPSRD